MGWQDKLRQYQLILNRTEFKPYSSKIELISYLEQNGFCIRSRSFDRVVQDLRKAFGISIKYNKSQKGYFIDKDETLGSDIEGFVRMLQTINLAELFQSSVKEGNDFFKQVSFDKMYDLKGMGNLKDLILAIKNSQVVSFDHYSFQKKTISRFQVYPYGLHEYNNRWYLRAIPKGDSNFLTFGIDRIMNLEIQKETFTKDPNKDPNAIFKDIIGIRASESKEKEHIILSFSPWRGNYLESLKIHPSQTIIENNDKEYRISIYVIPNLELEDLIYAYADSVKVIEPEWLVIKIKEGLIKTLQQYK
ncbi:helix-turn-helix transcriptional regulator [Namhaeicola litoreus]|uniref:Helix-turn-helix transcriptional regulator n=1 Tax=Namhaeicola litoreus TaxID=1052145 RepID=A0ABW3Y139_9FLAO